MLGVSLLSFPCLAADQESISKTMIYGDNAGTETKLSVDSAGRLLTSDVAATPVNTTEVVQVALTSTNSASGVDTAYTITNGKTLRIQILQAGAEADPTAGSKVTLFEDPNGA